VEDVIPAIARQWPRSQLGRIVLIHTKAMRFAHYGVDLFDPTVQQTYWMQSEDLAASDNHPTIQALCK